MKTMVLLSGGMDSVTALYDTKTHHEVVGSITFNYGSKHNEREIEFAEYHAKEACVPHHVIDLEFINELFKSDLLKTGGSIPHGHYEDDCMRQTVVPFRNGIMLSIAAGVAESQGAQGVVISAHSGDHAVYPDCREEFMEAMARAIQLGTYASVSLLYPFIKKTKADIVRIGIKIGVDYAQTWSCYEGRDIHCGRCGTCYERQEAFAKAHVMDPTEYMAGPQGS